MGDTHWTDVVDSTETADYQLTNFASLLWIINIAHIKHQCFTTRLDHSLDGALLANNIKF